MLATTPINSTNLSTVGEKMGDNSNIRVIKNGTGSIDEELRLTGVKTIIIENGNLVINKDISYDPLSSGTPSSYAFIVKNGDIVIGKDVTKIA